MSTGSPDPSPTSPGARSGPARFLADALTIGNGACGLVAIYYALDPFYIASGGFLLLAMLFDALDGAAARRFGSWHSKGHLVDTAADLVTMAAAPAVLIWSAISHIAPDLMWLAITAASIYAACAVTRLVNYAVRGHRERNFRGLPSPGGMLMVLLVVFLLGPTPFLIQAPLAMGLVVSVLSPLMVVPVPYPKVKGRWILPLAVAGIAVGAPAIYVYLATPSYESPIVKIGAVVALVYFLGYILSGPVSVMISRRESDEARVT